MQRIAIHSVPRSGSTWLGSIMDSNPEVQYRMQPLFSYAFKDYLNEHSTSERIGQFFKEIAISNDPFICQEEEKKKGIIPYFKKYETFTHICYKEVRYHHILENLLRKDSQIKVIGLIRNPFAVINSWLKAPKEFRADLGWKTEEEWRYGLKKNKEKVEEFNGYEKWKEVAYLFLNLKQTFPERIHLVQYENLLNDPVSETKKIFDFSSLEVHPQTLEFLKSSVSIHQKNAYSVFKSKVNDQAWKIELPVSVIMEIKNDPDFWKLNDKFYWI